MQQLNQLQKFSFLLLQTLPFPRLTEGSKINQIKFQLRPAGSLLQQNAEGSPSSAGVKEGVGFNKKEPYRY